MIFHIATEKNLVKAKQSNKYIVESILTEGFIHCSKIDQVIEVANLIFKGQKNLKLLVIDENKVKSEIKYDVSGNGKFYPHIYGSLNLDSIIDIFDITENDNGFKLPEELIKKIEEKHWNS